MPERGVASKGEIVIYGPNERGQYFAAGRGRTIREQFEAFHAEHPEVYGELVKVSRQVRGRRAHWSIGAAFEVVRYYRMIGPDEGEPFLLNNNYRSYYARLIMANEPDLEGFFALRELREATQDARDVVRGAGQ